MRRVVIFAHYDKDNLVDNYVLYYLKALKMIADEIVFVSCNNIVNKSVLDGLVSNIIDEPHKEYDFGSYKRGYLSIKNRLSDFDELIFVFYSCFGPLYPLTNVFNYMESKDYDFWGITKNNFGSVKGKRPIKRPHIQSYFIVFKNAIFMSEVFSKFIESIKEEDNKQNIVFNYEIGLSELLTKSGFKSGTLVEKYPNVDNIAVLRWYQIILKDRMPLIKTSIFRNQNVKVVTYDGFDDVIKNCSDYPLSLITDYMKRYDITYKKSNYVVIKIKRFAFYVASLCSPITRRIVVLLFGYILKYLKDKL